MEGGLAKAATWSGAAVIPHPPFSEADTFHTSLLKKDSQRCQNHKVVEPRSIGQRNLAKKVNRPGFSGDSIS
jgi:hypothetical protein